MSFDGRRLRTAGELKALAHPLRMDIIEQLSINGAMTASELGDALDETPANCSWHLRKLAEHKFVEETHDGHGRRRPWQMTRIGVSFHALDADEPGAAVFNRTARALQSLMVEREVARFEHNAQAEDDWDLGASQSATYLTREEAASLAGRILELLMEHRGRLTGDEPVPEGASLVYMLSLLSADTGAE
ncbi:winged helix-turn-helix domain-containing protein [Leekyejoonella antrihumi]|uniref:Helix-turn-helix transcriptional regulator n=1 Tax=Leekyejoonella antrihumi TaxID=1660198 RepID=A0A563E142_9MICO|nr:helix-turn-helix domain-containing protein [Leekyejoonella antrihumi]TWP36089.1 helix-turn-helix transcriptional regulator [Leekyejoonella antrihumi]